MENLDHRKRQQPSQGGGWQRHPGCSWLDLGRPGLDLKGGTSGQQLERDSAERVPIAGRSGRRPPSLLGGSVARLPTRVGDDVLQEIGQPETVEQDLAFVANEDTRRLEIS